MNTPLKLILAGSILPLFGFSAAIGVHDTGVNSADALVAAGAQVAFWTLTGEPAGASEPIGGNPFRYHNPAYFADTATAAWVAPTASGNAGAGGIYTYELTFDLTGLDPATASIMGIFGTDNDGSIALNGNAPVATTSFAGFGSTTTFAFNSGFVAGLNKVDVKTNNGGDPTAIFVHFNGATAFTSSIPEPAAVFLTGAGLVALGWAKRRKSSGRKNK